MKLSQSKVTGTFVNKAGDVIAQDPSVTNTGSGVLLVKKKALLDFLRENDYDVIWAIMGEKLLLGTNGGGSGFKGRLEMGGAFRMRANGKLEGKSYTKVLPAHKD